MTIKSFAIQAHGFDGLKAVQRAVPEPGEREVLLRVRAMGLNYRDVEIVLGTYHTDFPLPLVPLSDCVGEVIATGPGITRVRQGDRVVVAFWERWNDGAFSLADAGAPLGGPKDGVLTEQFVALEDRLVVVPDALSDLEAASLPCAASTAWHALVTAGRLKAGETVLVQGTGGVSLFAMQFALMAGARVIATSSSDAKLERVKALGASGTVNYKRHPEWAAEVLRLTGGRGVDHVLEVGGPGSFGQALKAIRPGGQVNVIGYLGGANGATNPLEIFRRQATVRGIPVGSRWMLQELIAAYAASSLRPLIDRAFDWTDAANALRHLHSGDHFGKVVLSA
ncbi:NAD(P)-dependent alcohol dehydrogenase [Variovorax sp. J2P1-59]|uniref:zinc-dependent alcohol dehydrogenase family protein n=1 Tax=Variovorax flavidus TaxID=3053501 RepID=UPI002574E09A|nr:NAD(P)-dependent alcohol dehydrogenase [Variovorax sp. J2P1-59]MDM0078932.1 NAD(P)-dependent alcohol dehydrogenase [Variovorax sp. J2P1-59]